jgi:hypothetical protein
MVVRAQVRLRPTSGVNEDWYVNTFHMIPQTTPLAAATAFSVPVITFYRAIDTQLSAFVAQTGHIIRYYDLDEPEPRVPIDEETFDFDTAPAVSRMPPEVACCMSYRAYYESGTPNARRRGRVFVGPLGDSTVGPAGTFTNGFVDLLALAGQTFFNAVHDTDEALMAIYSPTDGVAHEARLLWVDNEIDIQRRRSTRASYRKDWPVNPGP